MNTVKISDPSPGEKRKKISFGAAGLSLFFHIGVFILIGGAVVVEYAVPRHPMTGEVVQAVEAEEPAPEDKSEPLSEPDSSEEPASSNSAPASDSAPAELSQSSVDVLTVNSPSANFQMPTLGGSNATGTGTGKAGTGTGTALKGKGGKISNPFGGEDQTENTWEGYLYDLKQTKDGQPSGMEPTSKYTALLASFFSKNWDRKILDEFYRVKKPLYTSQIYMPLKYAALAPEAFHVASEVQPSMWVIIYKGTFQAPEAGQYRLAGYADDVLVVRINGKVVMDASRDTMVMGGKSFMLTAPVQNFVAAEPVANGCLCYSDWMHFNPSDTNKVEIMVGERPGGEFCAFLFVEQKGKTYAKESNGRPILPIFRTIDAETTPDGVAFDPNGPVFEKK